MTCCGLDTEGGVPSGGAAALSQVLAVGNETGGTDIQIDNGDSIVGEDEAASDAGAVTLRAGDYTTADVSNFSGGALTIRAGDTATTHTGADGGALTIRGGSGPTPGPLSVTGGEARNFDTDHEFGGSTLVGSANGAFNTTTFRGSDGNGTGNAGPTVVRGGDALASGSGSNSGGNLILRGGQSRVSSSGPGDVIVRSGGPNSTTASTTADVLITTTATAVSGDPTGAQGGANTNSGDVTITTGPAAASAASCGDIAIEAGSTAATTGNDPGSVTITAGSMNQNNQNNVGGRNVDITAGNSASDFSNGNAGAVTLTGGDQTGNGSSLGGNVELVAGDSDTGSGDAGDVILQPGIVTGGGSGADGNVEALTGDGGALRVRTQTTGYEETANEQKTYAEGTVSVPAGGTLDVVTLGEIDTDGQNLKMQIEVTGVDSTDNTVVTATVIMRSAYRTGGTVSLLSANLRDVQGSGIGTGFDQVTFAPAVSGTTIVLRATNSDGASAHAGHVAVRWSRQTGGLTA